MGEFLSPRPEIAEETEGDIDIIHEKANRLLRSRVGRFVLLGLGLLTLSLIGKPKRVETGTFAMPETKIVMVDGTICDFSNLEDLDFNENSELVRPNPTIEKMIKKQEPILQDMGILPIKFENQVKFHQWVESQMNQPGLLNAVGTESLETASAKQLVELSALVVEENLTYSRDATIISPPTDLTLMNHYPAECGHYAASTVAVFNEAKVDHPNLNNIYLNTVSSSTEAHSFCQVINVESPETVSIAYIDPTAADTPWGGEYIKSASFLDLANDMYEKKIVDYTSYLLMGSEYFQTTTVNPQLELDFLIKHAISNPTPEILDIKIKMTENFLSKNLSEEQRVAGQNLLQSFEEMKTLGTG